jgi:hypothetical protein
LKHLLIGDNSFLGISHLSQSRGRSTGLSLETEDKVKIIEKAASCGATGFTFSTDPTNFQVLSGLASSNQIMEDFAVYPVLPYAARYVRVVNEKGITGLMNDILSRLSAMEKAKLLVQSGISALTFDPLGLMRAYMDYELSQIPKNTKIHSVLLHEVITDLAVSFGSTEILQQFTKHIRHKWHAVPGFVTRNFTKFVDLCLKMNQPLSDIFIMAPFNSIGFQMNPSRESCETCLSKMSDSNVIAMSILASGYLSLNDAITYIRHSSHISGVAVGVSSLDHAENTFRKLQELTSVKPTTS